MVSQEQFINRQGWAIFNRKLGKRLTRCAAHNFRPGIGREELLAQTNRTYKAEYGFDPITMLIISILAQLIVKAIMAWWEKHHGEAEASIASWRSDEWPA